jgi:hypothetical protein
MRVGRGKPTTALIFITPMLTFFCGQKHMITNRWYKKSLLLVVVPVLIISSLSAFAGEYEVKGKAGDYDIAVRIEKNPPARGYNNIDVAVMDANGKPVTNVQVRVEYLMPSLPGRPPMMEYSTTAKPSGHYYLARLDFSMAGEWTVILKVIRAGKTDTMEFSFVVR